MSLLSFSQGAGALGAAGLGLVLGPGSPGTARGGVWVMSSERVRDMGVQGFGVVAVWGLAL